MVYQGARLVIKRTALYTPFSHWGADQQTQHLERPQTSAIRTRDMYFYVSPIATQNAAPPTVLMDNVICQGLMRCIWKQHSQGLTVLISNSLFMDVADALDFSSFASSLTAKIEDSVFFRAQHGIRVELRWGAIHIHLDRCWFMLTDFGLASAGSGSVRADGPDQAFHVGRSVFVDNQNAISIAYRQVDPALEDVLFYRNDVAFSGKAQLLSDVTFLDNRISLRLYYSGVLEMASVVNRVNFISAECHIEYSGSWNLEVNLSGVSLAWNASSPDEVGAQICGGGHLHISGLAFFPSFHHGMFQEDACARCGDWFNMEWAGFIRMERGFFVMYDDQKVLHSGQVIHDALRQGYDPSGMTWREFTEDLGQMLDAVRAYQTVGTQTSTSTSTVSTTTSATAMLLTCGSSVAASTVGRTSSVGYESGDARHIFCPPEGIGDVLFSTCGSSFDTSLSIMGQDLWRSCDDCGSCWNRAEIRVAGLSPGRCYDVVVDGKGRTEGAFQLSASCCYTAECSGRGIVRHRARASDSACRCECFWPYTGPMCDECRAESMSVFLNGTCQPCLASAGTAKLALHGSNVTWSPNFIDARCRDSIRIHHFVHRSAHGLLRTVASGDDGSFAFELGSCSHPSLHSLRIHITANGRLRGSVQCVPQITCPELLLSNKSMPSVSIQMLEWDIAAATVALAFVDLLFGLFPIGTISINLVPWNGDVNATLHATSAVHALAFFNRRLDSALGMRPCSAARSTQANNEAGLLVLVGRCSGDIGEALEEALSEQWMLHLGGEPGEPSKTSNLWHTFPLGRERQGVQAFSEGPVSSCPVGFKL